MIFGRPSWRCSSTTATLRPSPPTANWWCAACCAPDLFTVVHEQFLTDTTDYADIVLPATTFLEHKDLQTAYGHYYLQHSEQSIAALGEARSNSDLFRALAARMGFEEECFRQSDRQVMAEALNSPSPWLEDITLETLDRRPPPAPALFTAGQRALSPFRRRRLWHRQRQGGGLQRWPGASRP